MNYDLINAYFDELDKAFQRELAAQGRNDKKHPGFDQMIWFVKAWSKITLNIKGGSARKPATVYLQERTGASLTTKGWNYYKEADRMEGRFADYFERWSESRQKDGSDSTNPMNEDDYKRADNAMLDMFSDYLFSQRGDVSSAKQQEFRRQLTEWGNLSAKDQLATEVFNMDRSI